MREGWVKKKLGDVCTLQRGFDLPKRLREKGKYPLISSSGCIDSHTEAKVSGPGVVTGRSGSIGSTFFIDKDFWPLNTTLYVKDFHGNDPQFVFRLLEKFDLKSYASGAGVPTLNRNNVHSESVIVPSAVSEQKRIVAILDEVFAGIDDAIANTEKNLTNARELFESSLQFIFSEKGKNWMRLTLLELLERKWITSHLDGNHGGDYPKKDEFVRSGIPYISANCLKNESIDISLAKYLTPERAASLRKGIAKDNDVLFAHNATVGPVTILHTEEEKVILSTSLTYYRCDPTQILPEYLAHYMRSKEFKSQYESVMRQSTRNQVPITKQRTFYHIIPPIEEQKNIAVYLDNLSTELMKLEAIYQQKLTALNELKQSILQKAFTGELTADTASQATRAKAEIAA